jgi:hypothetical protein
MWPIEEIPSEHFLFMRIHAMYLKFGDPIGAFKDIEGGMSTDWEKYSTPQEARNRAKKPNDNGIVKLNAGKVRELQGMAVRHTPEPTNRAHSEVFGEKTPEIRLKLNRLAEWVIALNPS